MRSRLLSGLQHKNQGIDRLPGATAAEMAKVDHCCAHLANEHYLSNASPFAEKPSISIQFLFVKQNSIFRLLGLFYPQGIISTL